MKRSGTTNVHCVTTHDASPNVFEHPYARLMQNSNHTSPLPNPLPEDYLIPLLFPHPLPFPLRLPLPKNFSLPLPLPFGSEKVTPANAYFLPHHPRLLHLRLLHLLLFLLPASCRASAGRTRAGGTAKLLTVKRTAAGAAAAAARQG
jgi:hypothetical protein